MADNLPEPELGPDPAVPDAPPAHITIRKKRKTRQRKKIKISIVGRPTKITEEVLQKIVKAFAVGATDEEACAHAQISTSTLYAYQNQHPEFLDIKEQLKVLPTFQARNVIVEAIQRNALAPSQWYLERKLRHEFGSAPVPLAVFNVSDILDKIESPDKLDKLDAPEKRESRVVESVESPEKPNRDNDMSQS